MTEASSARNSLRSFASAMIPVRTKVKDHTMPPCPKCGGKLEDNYECFYCEEE